jgi:hypothetical protein
MFVAFFLWDEYASQHDASMGIQHFPYNWWCQVFNTHKQKKNTNQPTKVKMSIVQNPPCLGNCQHGDAGWFHLQGKNGDVTENYDGSKCGCKKCVNHAMCNTWSPPEHLFNDGRCIPCDMYIGKLDFVSSDDLLHCPICLCDQPHSVKHPAKCGHTLCVDCFSEMFLPKPPLYPSLVDYNLVMTCTCAECLACQDNDVEDGYFPCKDQCNTFCSEQKSEFDAYANIYTVAHSRSKVLACRTSAYTCSMCRAKATTTPYDPNQ